MSVARGNGVYGKGEYGREVKFRFEFYVELKISEVNGEPLMRVERYT